MSIQTDRLRNWFAEVGLVLAYDECIADGGEESNDHFLLYRLKYRRSRMYSLVKEFKSLLKCVRETTLAVGLNKEDVT